MKVSKIEKALEGLFSLSSKQWVDVRDISSQVGKFVEHGVIRYGKINRDYIWKDRKLYAMPSLLRRVIVMCGIEVDSCKPYILRFMLREGPTENETPGSVLFRTTALNVLIRKNLNCNGENNVPNKHKDKHKQKNKSNNENVLGICDSLQIPMKGGKQKVGGGIELLFNNPKKYVFFGENRSNTVRFFSAWRGYSIVLAMHDISKSKSDCKTVHEIRTISDFNNLTNNDIGRSRMIESIGGDRLTKNIDKYIRKYLKFECEIEEVVSEKTK